MPPIHTLQDFIRLLEREGELKRITRAVEPVLEAAAIAVESMRNGGPALLFENIIGASYPLAMNVLASDRRIELALGGHPSELGQKLIRFAEAVMPPKPREM